MGDKGIKDQFPTTKDIRADWKTGFISDDMWSSLYKEVISSDGISTHLSQALLEELITRYNIPRKYITKDIVNNFENYLSLLCTKTCSNNIILNDFKKECRNAIVFLNVAIKDLIKNEKQHLTSISPMPAQYPQQYQ